MTYFQRSAEAIERLAESPPESLEPFLESMFETWEEGGKVVSFGNGGSATDSLHFTTELVARMKEAPIQRPAMSLVGSPSNLTAVSNDWSFEEVFEKQVESMVGASDTVLGISTSGNSENVYRGLEEAQSLGARCFGLTGRNGGRLANLDISLIRVPVEETSVVQEAHITCLHAICERVDRRLNGE